MAHKPTFRHPIGRTERLRRRLAVAARRKFGRVPFVVRAQGARFMVDPVDFIDDLIAHDGIWDGPQLDDLAAVAHGRRIDTFLDVGANSGFYAVMFAMKNLADDIIAFEPDPGNFARLSENIALNGLGARIRTVPIALGDAAGEVTLYEGAKWNRGESTIAEPDQTPKEITHQVRQVRFDDEFAIAGQQIIVKMDVEGYEFHTIAGMERTLTANECYVQIELYSERLEELKEVMARLGYRFLHTIHIDHFFTNMKGVG
jgi:FkbM family methyltransferase